MTRDGLVELEKVLALLDRATPGEWPQPVPSRFGTDHFIIENHPLPHIAAIKREEDACVAVAAVNFLREHGAALRDGARDAEGAYQRGLRDGYEQRHAEVLGALV